MRARRGSPLAPPDPDGATLRALGVELGLSYERIRQIERSALQKVAVALRERLGDDAVEQLRADLLFGTPGRR